jgi:dTDP-4-dehydrorhamnose reductase
LAGISHERRRREGVMTAGTPILVAGKNGQLARSLATQAKRRDTPLQAIGRPEIDLMRPESIHAVLSAVRPRAIVNAAAYTAVDRAEIDSANAFAVNSTGAACLAEAAAKFGIPLIHVSTDYVFDGRKRAPYVEEDSPSPLGVYGASKLGGEIAVRRAHPAATILRTAWLYSVWPPNFVATMLRLASERPVLRVVDDQCGNPTSAFDLADAILDLIDRPECRGALYHLSGRGETTWYGFAEAIFEGWSQRGRRVSRLERISTQDYGAPAPRPADSRLDCSKAEGDLGISLPDWRNSLEACLDAMMHDPNVGPSSKVWLREPD